MGTSIKLRRGTNAEWTAVDPVLLAGELGIEIETAATSFLMKCGNGTNVWSDLNYLSPASIASFLEDNPSNGEVAKAPTSNWAFDHNAKTTDTHGAVGADRLALLSDISSIDELLSSALPENTAIILDAALSADGKYSGGIVRTFTVGENLAAGEAGYLKAADSKVWKTDGDAEATTKPLVLMALAAINADAAGLFAVVGVAIRKDSWNWTVGAPLFIDTTTAGGLTETPSTTVGDFNKCVGHAITADEMLWNPDNAWVEVV